MTFTDEYINSIKEWIRPLQKSLTIELENEFCNTLGRQKYFSDYIYESFTKLEKLNLSEENFRLFKILANKYHEYNKLDLNQRKRLVVETRKSLYKLGKSFDKNYSGITKKCNYSNVFD